MKTEFSSLYELFEAIPDEQAAIDHFRSIRWRNGEWCQYCRSVEVYHFSDKRTHKCAACRQRFSIKVGTIFEDTKIPFRKWLAAIWLVTSHKKGIASTQLARDIGVTQKTAWFMLHRLRHAARTRSFTRPLRGTVEVDETFVGGKNENCHRSKRRKGRGPLSQNHSIVLGLLERGGELRADVVPGTSMQTLAPIVFGTVEPGARVITDETSPIADSRRVSSTTPSPTPAASTAAASSTPTRSKASGRF